MGDLDYTLARLVTAERALDAAQRAFTRATEEASSDDLAGYQANSYMVDWFRLIDALDDDLRVGKRGSNVYHSLSPDTAGETSCGRIAHGMITVLLKGRRPCRRCDQ